MDHTTKPFVKLQVTSAKLVASPTRNAWSQAYNAGTVFALLSLEKTEQSPEDTILSALGKDILNTFEEEYFVLEKKTLSSIKSAIQKASDKFDKTVQTSFLVTSLQPVPIEDEQTTIMYAFALGKASILLKRHGKIGSILKGEEIITTASGILEDKDIIILLTQAFSTIITKDNLTNALSLQTPDEIVETLAPKIHEKEGGISSAIFILHQNHTTRKEKEESQQKAVEEYQEKEEKKRSLIPFPSFSLPKLSLPHPILGLNHKKRLLLTIAIIIFGMLILSIFFSFKKQQDLKIRAAFEEVYPYAQRKIEEGESLINLNKTLAREGFENAVKILSSDKAIFPKDSGEAKKVAALKHKAEQLLQSLSSISITPVKEVSSSKSPLLTAILQTNSLYAAADDKTIYLATIKDVVSKETASGKKTTIITNNNDWSALGGLGTFLGNIYLLDKKTNQILKYIPSGNTFTKTNYLASGLSPDFSKAKGLAIDGSVWVVLEDGTILKFTKGSSDSFNTKNLPQKISRAARIFTNPDMENLYILDTNTSSIIVLNKSGKFQTLYKASVLAQAKDFDINEKDKKAYILSSGKIWEMAL